MHPAALARKFALGAFIAVCLSLLGTRPTFAQG